MNLITDNLLFYLSNEYDKTTRQAIESFLLDNFTPEDVLTAKNILIAECDKVGICDEISDFKKGRQKKNILQKVSKDILDIWDVVDRLKGGQLLCQFVSAGNVTLRIRATSLLNRPNNLTLKF